MRVASAPVVEDAERHLVPLEEDDLALRQRASPPVIGGEEYRRPLKKAAQCE
jgi:hypothetical protein